MVPENDSPSPDSSGNPFLFFFKKEKIATNSWISFLTKRHKKTANLTKGGFCFIL
jgi:hypothetical protein